MQGKRGINQYRRTGNRKLGAGASKTKNGGEFLKKNQKKKGFTEETVTGKFRRWSFRMMSPDGSRVRSFADICEWIRLDKIRLD
jgi:hypothetical protein